MANYEINEEQEVLTKAMRMIETGDPVHADVYNVLFSALLNNDVFLEKLANKMVQQAMISHVMDSTNSNMVLGADQGPVITKLIDKVQEQVTVLNTNLKKRFAIMDTTYNSPSDFPNTGCGFGVNTLPITLYGNFTVPTFSRICFLNYGTSLDGAIIAITPDGDLYTAFRISGKWKNGKIH